MPSKAHLRRVKAARKSIARQAAAEGVDVWDRLAVARWDRERIRQIHAQVIARGKNKKGDQA